jgi:gamma-butyrobetaine dioxygenase
VLASLLHDVGHLVEAIGDDIAGWTTDAHHEDAGSRWLGRNFGPAVCEPVRLHVAAKRYLCAVDPAYARRLSSASVITLSLQGGPMSPDEVLAFEREPHAADAVRLRGFDDHGKVRGLPTEGFDAWRSLIEALAIRR